MKFQKIKKIIFLSFLISHLPFVFSSFSMINSLYKQILWMKDKSIIEKYKILIPVYGDLMKIKKELPDSGYIFSKHIDKSLEGYFSIFFYPLKVVYYEEFQRLKRGGQKNLIVIEYLTRDKVKIEFYNVIKVR